MKFTPEKRDWLNDRLLAWYGLSKRALPWRETRDPYRILLSEIMCQQTQVQTVIPYYERFLEALPTLEALSEAPMSQVLKLWEGLGYYRRARMLKTLAEVVLKEYNGILPRTRDALLKLPGIGTYTSAAIASIVFGEPEGVVDGNVYRVYSRFFNLDWDISLGESRKCFQSLANQLVSKTAPGDYNQAVMELGATVCSPGQPSCHNCPISTRCAVVQQGINPSKRPVKSKKTKVRKQVFNCYWVQDQGKLLLVKRPEQGLLSGLWELPTDLAGMELLERKTDQDADMVIHHKYSHIDATYRIFLKKTGCSSFKIPDELEHAWVTSEHVKKIPVTGVMKKVFEASKEF